jgi:ferredoxin-nitrate reductase
MTAISTKTLCPYCGVGCGLEVMGTAGSDQPSQPQPAPVKVRGDRTHPSSRGQICVKGGTIADSLDRDRLLYPMYRPTLDQDFQRVSWEAAYGHIVQQMERVLATQGADGICMYGSGQLQTEDYYVAQKLLKGCLKTNNFDSNSRLCMSSAVSGYIRSFGSDGPPCCYEDLDLTDCALIIGSNTAECHPIVFNRLRKNHKANPQTRLIVVDPRRTETAAVADLHLAIRPGTDIDLLNGMAHLLHRWGCIDQDFIDRHTDGWDAYRQVISHYPPGVVADRCGLAIADLEAAARLWAEASGALSLWCVGVNQSSEGTAKVQAIIDLHLATGQLCRPGAGPFSLTGQPNAMGGREAGGLCKLLPGYRLVNQAQDRADVERAWNLPGGSIPPRPGRSAWEMITGLEQGEVGVLWVVATNPAVSMPDLERTKAALRNSPFTIHQDAYYPTETATFAHLLLPAAQWGEKTGTMTNSERVVTLCDAFRPPPGEAKADWEIFAEVGCRLGFTPWLSFQDGAQVFAEFVTLTQGQVCDMSGLSHQRLRQQGPLQWPYPLHEDSEDLEDPEDPAALTQTKRLYGDGQFPTANGRAQFGAHHARGLAEPADPDYPFVLTTGRLYGHWHTQTRTGRIAKITKMHPQPFLEMHPKDADRLQLGDSQWVELRSRRGKARLPVRITWAITPGTVFMPMHWGFLWADDAECNSLTHSLSCPDSLQPELKACAVQIQGVSSGLQP